MKLEFLRDYEQRELEEQRKFVERVQERAFTPEDMFPRKERFSVINQPTSRIQKLGSYSPKDNIWSRIALSGTTFISLSPFPKPIFEEKHGFRISQIPEIIEFIKDTGKIQFVLRLKPTEYVKLEFLTPIFEELRPPMICAIPLEAFVDRELIDKYASEFITLSKVRLLKNIKEWALAREMSVEAMLTIIAEDAATYLFLKVLGYDELIQEVEDAVVADPAKAQEMLRLMSLLVTYPKTDALVKSYTMDFELCGKINEFARSRQLRPAELDLKCEIGQFLMCKLTHYPSSLNACRELIAHYEEQDVYKVASALNDAIRKGNSDLAQHTSQELSNVMDNIWEDTSLNRKITGVRFGIPVFFAAVGTVAGGLSGGLGGFLAGLGLSTVSEFVKIKSETIAEKIAKLSSPNYETIVYDFKKKCKKGQCPSTKKRRYH